MSMAQYGVSGWRLAAGTAGRRVSRCRRLRGGAAARWTTELLSSALRPAAAMQGAK
jgi:hypothetical protein